jgi:hypothetical protein
LFDCNLFCDTDATKDIKIEKGPGEPSRLFNLEDWPGPFFWAFIKLGNNLINYHKDSTADVNMA